MKCLVLGLSHVYYHLSAYYLFFYSTIDFIGTKADFRLNYSTNIFTDTKTPLPNATETRLKQQRTQAPEGEGKEREKEIDETRGGVTYRPSSRRDLRSAVV